MKDLMFWLALMMAVVPFIEQAAADPFVTSRPWLAALLAGTAVAARFVWKWYAAKKVVTPEDKPSDGNVISPK